MSRSPEVQKVITETAARAGIRRVCGIYAPTVNCTAFTEEVCDELLKRHPTALFAACWRECANGDQVWTLRSRKQDGSEGRKCNVEKLVQRMYGGGTSTYARFIERAIDIDKVLEERDELIAAAMERASF